MSRKIKKEAGSGPVMNGADEQAPLSRQIDDNLRKVYTSAMEEQIPDRFLRLLAELREREKKA